MKINSVISLIKKSSTNMLYLAKDGTQWLSDGNGAYPLYGLPELDTNSLRILLDIQEKDRGKHNITYSGTPEEYSFSDHCDNEELVQEAHLPTLGWGGYVLSPLLTSNGIKFINPAYLKPITDDYEIYERVTPGGETYLAVKTGFVLAALLNPLNINERTLANSLNILRLELSDSLRAAGYAVNPSTGEVMEKING